MFKITNNFSKFAFFFASLTTMVTAMENPRTGLPITNTNQLFGILFPEHGDLQPRTANVVQLPEEGEFWRIEEVGSTRIEIVQNSPEPLQTKQQKYIHIFNNIGQLKLSEVLAISPVLAAKVKQIQDQNFEEENPLPVICEGTEGDVSLSYQMPELSSQPYVNAQNKLKNAKNDDARYDIIQNILRAGLPSITFEFKLTPVTEKEGEETQPEEALKADKNQKSRRQLKKEARQAAEEAERQRKEEEDRRAEEAEPVRQAQAPALQRPTPPATVADNSKLTRLFSLRKV